ncbi:MAG: hypothetical protein HZB42_14730 [Sphingobacteriales bacterium]|nr:hypothetical protein [Sphingobacteriales bacterium]
MTWNSTMGLISSIALFLPVFFILILRLGGYRTFPALLIYYLIVLTYNLFSLQYINPGKDIQHYWGIANNLLDTPLMLIFLTYFSTSQLLSRRMKAIIIGFLVFEIAVISWKGITVDAITIIMGPGLAVVVGFCLYFFVRQSKITIMHGKATGKAIISASLVFAYGCYSIIYIMYYIFKTQHVADTFLIYFLVTTFSSLLITAGIIIERKRVQKLNEVKIARKELAAIYKDAGPSRPFRGTPMLDFDKEPWNN